LPPRSVSTRFAITVPMLLSFIRVAPLLPEDATTKIPHPDIIEGRTTAMQPNYASAARAY
jgi:hypothetical protein